MNKLTGFVTITRKGYSGDRGKAVAYTKDGRYFDAAVMLDSSYVISGKSFGDIYWQEWIHDDDEVREASDEEIAFFKLKTEFFNYNDATSSKDFLESHIVSINYNFNRSIRRWEIDMVDAESAKKACRLALKELATKLLKKKFLNSLFTELEQIRDEKI